MSDERPETCEKCGAPVVWCKCKPEYAELERERDVLRARNEAANKEIGTLRALDISASALIEKLRARIAELTEQANAAYAPYRERVMAAREEANKHAVRAERAEAVAQAGNAVFQFGKADHDTGCAIRKWPDAECDCGKDQLRSDFIRAWDMWQRGGEDVPTVQNQEG